MQTSVRPTQPERRRTSQHANLWHGGWSRRYSLLIWSLRWWSKEVWYREDIWRSLHSYSQHDIWVGEIQPLSTRGGWVSIDAFITDLYTLAEHCNYKSSWRPHQRQDCGWYKRFSTIWADANGFTANTIASAIALIRQKEVVKSQQKELRGTSPIVGAIQKLGVENSRSRKDQTLSVAEALLMIANNIRCPAWTVGCRKCKKQGHLQVVYMQIPS